jgi:hypothetical protein
VAVDPQTILSALPWVRRGWRMLPPQARPVVLVAVAGVALWYAWKGRQQLTDMRTQASQQPYHS